MFFICTFFLGDNIYKFSCPAVDLLVRKFDLGNQIQFTANQKGINVKRSCLFLFAEYILNYYEWHTKGKAEIIRHYSFTL